MTAKARLHTPESLARCQAACDAANAHGRALHGQRWAPDLRPCGAPELPNCRACVYGPEAADLFAQPERAARRQADRSLLA